jgi:hypothetical protein
VMKSASHTVSIWFGIAAKSNLTTVCRWTPQWTVRSCYFAAPKELLPSLFPRPAQSVARARGEAMYGHVVAPRQAVEALLGGPDQVHIDRGRASDDSGGATGSGGSRAGNASIAGGAPGDGSEANACLQRHPEQCSQRRWPLARRLAANSFRCLRAESENDARVPAGNGYIAAGDQVLLTNQPGEMYFFVCDRMDENILLLQQEQQERTHRRRCTAQRRI